MTFKDRVGKFIEEWREAGGRPHDFPSFESVVEAVGCSISTAKKHIRHFKKMDEIVLLDQSYGRRDVPPKRRVNTKKRKAVAREKRDLKNPPSKELKIIRRINEEFGLKLKTSVGFADQYTGKYTEFTVLTHYHNLPLRIAIDNLKANGITVRKQIAKELDIEMKWINKFYHAKKRHRGF